MNIQSICDTIIIIGTAYFMIIKFIDSFAKPTSKIKQKRKEKELKDLKDVLDKIMPDYLDEHDLKTREKYLSDRQKYLEDIKKAVLEDSRDTLEQIKEINNEQNIQLNRLDSMINNLNQGSRDVLRQKIMSIYNRHKKDKTLTFDERDDLDALYADYKAIGGNSYIDRRYNRMIKWKVLEDDYIED